MGTLHPKKKPTCGRATGGLEKSAGDDYFINSATLSLMEAVQIS